MSSIGIPITSLDGSTTAPPATPIVAPQPPATPQLNVIPELRMPQNPQDALNQVATFAVAGLSASADAAVKNKAVLDGVQKAQDTNYAALLEANKNLHKINAMPKGISHILGMFDDSWNASNQALNVEAANITQQHVVSQAQTMIQNNNTLGDLIEKQAGVAEKLQSGELAVDANSMEHTKLQQAAIGLKMESIRTSIAMSAEARAKAEFAVSGMGLDDTNSMIARIKANPKDPNRPMLGMLEEHATKVPLAIAALQSAQTAAAKGNREEEQAGYQTFTDNLGVPQLQGPIEAAMNSGSSTVTFGSGKNTIQIPLGIAIRSYQGQQKLETDARSRLAQESAENNDIFGRTNRQAAAATALSSIDPRAKNVLTMLNQGATALQKNHSYENVLNFKAIQDNNEPLLKDIASNFAKTFESKPAQAAIEQFGVTGKFDQNGAGAVLGDAIGNPALANTTKYGAAFNIMNQAVAKQLAAAQVQGGSGLTGQVGTMDQADLAAMLAQGKSNPKLAQIKENVLSDPTTMNSVKDTIKSSMQKDALESAITNLSRSKNASPVWQNLIDRTDQIMKPDGKGNYTYDLGKLAEQLERATVMTHGKVNYSGAFLSALRQHGSQIDALSGSDPRTTWADQAIIARVFGDKPNAAVAGDLANTFGAAASRAHAEMQKRVELDVSGKTQAQAVDTAARESQYGGLKGLPDPAKVPSATGIGYAQNIKSLYGGN